MSTSRIIVDSNGQEVTSVPKVIDIVPFGSTILVEILNAKEALGTLIEVNKDAKVGAPQGYVLALGPKLDPECGIKVGDRVMMQGTFVPVPDWDHSPRQKGILEIHNIKALIKEG